MTTTVAPTRNAASATEERLQEPSKFTVGSIITESAFVAAEFGDRILAFQHARGSKPDSRGKA